MAASLVKLLYSAPNGDCWTLCRDSAGKLLVCHQPNEASGGWATETAVDLFLSFGGHGPESQALREALADLGQGAHAHERNGELSAEDADSCHGRLEMLSLDAGAPCPKIFSTSYLRPQSCRKEKQSDRSLQSSCMASMTVPVMWGNHGRYRSRIAWEVRNCDRRQCVCTFSSGAP
jgi:hypothetical protein